jgi:hypothetical protein
LNFGIIHVIETVFVGRMVRNMELIASIVLIAITWAVIKAPSHEAHNRLCPPGKRLDYTQMGVDRSNGMSQRDIDIKTNNGGYDVPNDIHTTPARKR